MRTNWKNMLTNYLLTFLLLKSGDLKLSALKVNKTLAKTRGGGGYNINRINIGEVYETKKEK